MVYSTKTPAFLRELSKSLRDYYGFAAGEVLGDAAGEPLGATAAFPSP